jgi:hypothetical protein
MNRKAQLTLFIFVSLFLLLSPIACEKAKTEKPSSSAQNKTEEKQTPAYAVLRFDIKQNMELISLATFSEPPQFAIWLEDAESGRYQTIVATYRSATGDLIGKAECPGCLPLWFAVYVKETGKEGLPTMEEPAPAAVTYPTPLQEDFTIRRTVKYGGKFILWMEMNLAGDFNKNYTEADTDKTDWDYSGQPPLVYRCEIEAVPGKKYVPELFGQVDMSKPFDEMIVSVSDKVTTAKDVFKSIEIRVIPAEPNSTN